MAETNWSGNYAYRAPKTVSPTSVGELQELVRDSDRVKVLATRHSFNDMAETSGTLVRLIELPREIDLDEEARIVRVPGQLRYGDLALALEARGWAVANLASLPHISVAGAVQTGTHGSGNGNGSLATAVTAIEFIDGLGELRRLSRDDDPDVFPGAVVGLGALGIVVTLTLAIEPSFTVRQNVFENLPWEALAEHFDEITSLGYSVSSFTDWASPTVEQLWVKRRSGDEDLPADVFGARPATRERHPLPELSAENCTPQLGVAGPWHERLPHFRLEFTPSAGEELQTEYFLPRERVAEAIDVVRGLGSLIQPLLFVSEIRTIRADDLWLSPEQGRDTVAFHFTWHRDEPAVLAVLPQLEAALASFGARVHWGKVFTLPATEIASTYERMPNFLALRDRFDPHRVFENEYLTRVLAS